MALTISPPSPASSFTSDASSNSVSTGPPETPILSDLPLATPSSKAPVPGNAANAGGVKRTTKPSRRANTAERRATHNAVERQRRETLNGRFLDLAALLPNLSQIRRPSKSSIVNSSIAHITASRRHRILASQQLRALKAETDALRHEVNEWRMRAGVPGVEEPRRPDGFSIVLSGELEFEVGDLIEGGEEDEEEELRGGSYNAQYGSYEEPEDFIHLQQQPQQRRQPVELMGQPQFIAAEPPHHTPPMTIAIGQQPHPRSSHSPPAQSHFSSPPSAGAFDTSVYDQHSRQLHHHQMLLQHHMQQQEESKWAYQQQMHAQQVQGAW